MNVVTGAFGYTGKYITQRLLAQGEAVRNLTGHPDRPNPFGDRVSVARMAFDRPDELSAALQDADTLFNTYWIRFEHRGTTFAQAVENSRLLFEAAARAGVRRIVHTSIANPAETSPLPYYHGKALVEKALIECGVSYAILRPTVIFGSEDILINNIAWCLRHFPVFAVPGRGDARLQPIFVEDFADLAVRFGRDEGNSALDAVGPEAFTFDELLGLIKQVVRSRALIVHPPRRLTLLLAGFIGRIVGDVVITGEEIEGLAANLLVSDTPPLGTTRLSDWLRDHAGIVGARYHSEVQRHYRA
jgi:NADH dehydrogenase